MMLYSSISFNQTEAGKDKQELVKNYSAASLTRFPHSSLSRILQN
jgi:hypothetical protein